jgi:hypothetical protein
MVVLGATGGGMAAAGLAGCYSVDSVGPWAHVGCTGFCKDVADRLGWGLGVCTIYMHSTASAGQCSATGTNVVPPAWFRFRFRYGCGHCMV